jgi:hypothetical protein
VQTNQCQEEPEQIVIVVLEICKTTNYLVTRQLELVVDIWPPDVIGHPLVWDQPPTVFIN